MSATLHENRRFDALRVKRKDGRREALAINPQTAQRIRAYLERAGHGDQPDAPLCGNGKPLDPQGRMDPSAIDRLVRKYAKTIGLARGYSAHSMRRPSSRPRWRTAHSWRTCRRLRGHRAPSTTKLYNRRG